MRADEHQAIWAKFREEQGDNALPFAGKRRRHPKSLRRKIAKANQAPSLGALKPAPGSGNTATDLMQIKLDSDLHRISLQASRQRKHQMQRDILPEYDDYLQKTMAKPTGGEDPVLVQCMIWRYNLGHIEQAQQLAEHAIRHGLSMPEQFKANVKQFVCREIVYWALDQQKAGNDPEPYLSDIYVRSRNWDKPDQIEARLYKAKGNQLIETNPAKALEYFEKAAPLDDRIGVSQIIKRLTKQLAKTDPEPQKKQ